MVRRNQSEIRAVINIELTFAHWMAGHQSITYSTNFLCERFRAIELRKELCTTKGGGISEDPVASFGKQKGSRGSGRSEPGYGGIGESSRNSCSSSKGGRLNITREVCGREGTISVSAALQWGRRKADRAGTRPLPVGQTRMRAPNPNTVERPANKTNRAEPAGGDQARSRIRGY